MTNACISFIKHLSSVNEKGFNDIRFDNSNRVVESNKIVTLLEFNLSSIKHNPCENTFKTHQIPNFFYFYKTILSNYKKNCVEYPLSFSEAYSILGSISNFNNHLLDLSKKIE